MRLGLRQVIPALYLAVGMACGDEKKPVEPKIAISNANVEYYAVSGGNCEEAGADMRSKGYISDEGEWFAAKAETELWFACSYSPAPEQPDMPRKEFCCKASVEDLVTACDATVYLPQWGGSDKCWDRFINALTVHEQGHVDICQNYKGLLNDALEGLESRMCSLESMQEACDDALADLEQKADGEFGRVSGEHEDAQDAYDNGTNHGETQGAVLDCDCE